MHPASLYSRATVSRLSDIVKSFYPTNVRLAELENQE